ncbi:hypothetical protein Ddye_004923 [Dipteronia dyeriana]|uniref:Reverse transcriptase domain-containing protein n=1 Tax=Dipteronia dyeriana TaxID=168575 RepID=A0AAE0CP51_9ROSI|nr:hypothetical protein Ddye_004923 [Dipteronia dyeriana]
MKFINEFHGDGSIVMDLNNTFIMLIPKCSNSKSLREFRPITLVGSMYKVLAKVLANRLKLVMDMVIGGTQMAFVKDRQTIDSFMIAEKIINELMRSKEDGCLYDEGSNTAKTLNEALRVVIRKCDKLRTSGFITSLLLNIREGCSDLKVVKNGVKEEAWSPPSIGTLKFNVAGSVTGSPGIHDSNSAEIKAIHNACELCVSYDFLIGRDIEIINAKEAVS